MLVQSINPPQKLSRLELPLLGFLVPVGFPSPAENDVESKLDLNQLAVVHPSATFYVRVSDDSIIEGGIVDRDYLS